MGNLDNHLHRLMMSKTNKTSQSVQTFRISSNLLTISLQAPYPLTFNP